MNPKTRQGLVFFVLFRVWEKGYDGNRKTI